jgi:hypothetical protein
MTLDHKIQTLEDVCKSLIKAKIPFTLGGSGLLYYLGLVKNFNDLDLVLYCSEEEAHAALSTYPQTQNKSSGIYTSSFFFQVTHKEVKFDIMGYFGVKNLGQDFKLKYKVSKKVGMIPLGELKDWLTAYELMERTDKVEIIQNALTNVERI